VGYNTDDLELASDFQPLEAEANFPPTITREVVGGAHIAPHAITVEGSEYVMVDWQEGLPRHDKPGTRAVRFPHGLIRYGETFEKCAERLVSEQLGMRTESVQVVHIYSYLDEAPHWHIEPILLVRVSGTPRTPEKASVIRAPIGPQLPEYGKWWGKPPFDTTYQNYLRPHI
jgi:8-oxo-dGTP pyrophosphatase MutT (NUDIX family)